MRMSPVSIGSPLQVSTVVPSSFLSVLQLVGRPTAFLAGALGLWRFGVDLEWTKEFFIPGGLLSHYQLWFAVAVALPMYEFLLRRSVTNTANIRRREIV